eukprot:12145941-Alexandrium_andersonii.AAC.1
MESPRGSTGASSSATGPAPETSRARAGRRTCLLCLALASLEPGELCSACASAQSLVYSLNGLVLSDDERTEVA